MGFLGVTLAVIITGFFISEAIKDVADAVKKHDETMHASTVALIEFLNEGVRNE